MQLGDTLVIGVSVNNVTGISGKSYAGGDLLRAAVEAEAMGVDAIWVHDAPLGRRTLAALDPVTVLAAIAAQTKTLRLGTGILTPQLRNPVYLAQQWATLFALSGGRAIMGVGSGAGTPTLLKREFEALAALRHDPTLDPARLYEKRGALFDESLDVIRRLWAEDKFSYSGTFFRFDEVTLGEARPPAMPPVLVAAGIYFPLKPGAPVHHGWTEKHAGTFVLGPYKRVAAYGRLDDRPPQAGGIRSALGEDPGSFRRGVWRQAGCQGFQLLRQRRSRPGEGAAGGQGSPGGFPRSADLG